MSWSLRRSVLALIIVLVGGLLGQLAGAAVDAPLSGAVLGCVAAVALMVFRDMLRALRLIAWLRGSQTDSAPRDSGLWGEIGYRVERLLRERERLIKLEQARLSQFLSAIEASPNGVMLLDAGDHVQWCSVAGAAHFGLDPQRDLLQRITNLVRTPAFVEHLQSGLFLAPVKIPTPQGRGTLSVFIRSYGEGMKLVVSQDVTERDRAEAMRRDFVANVSHEIRTPLTVLSGFIETMSGVPLTEVERARVLVLMGQQTRRMQALVSDLLTLAQLEGSPRPGVEEWIPVAQLLKQVEGDAQVLSAGRHALTMACDESAQIAGAQHELLSAIGNLVGNAVRYTPEGGRIDVTWRPLPSGGAELSVRDTGIGIERDQLPRLAERFYRVDGSRSRDTGGTGLGLSIVKHVMQRHGGELDIRSEPGKGSTFSLVLPAARVRHITPASHAPELPAAATDRH